MDKQALIEKNEDIRRKINAVRITTVIFARSKNAVEMFGEAGTKKFAAHADALRKRGDKYCNCLACRYGLEVLKHKDLLRA